MMIRCRARMKMKAARPAPELRRTPPKRGLKEFFPTLGKLGGDDKPNSVVDVPRGATDVWPFL